MVFSNFLLWDNYLNIQAFQVLKSEFNWTWCNFEFSTFWRNDFWALLFVISEKMHGLIWYFTIVIWLWTHFSVARAYTGRWISRMEFRVASFHDINLWIEELWIISCIVSSIKASQLRIHKRTSFLTEFTVEDNYRLLWHHCLNVIFGTK